MEPARGDTATSAKRKIKINSGRKIKTKGGIKGREKRRPRAALRSRAG